MQKQRVDRWILLVPLLTALANLVAIIVKHFLP